MNIQLVLFLIMISPFSGQSVTTEEKCTCSTVKSKFDCVALGCTFTPSTTTTAATCTSTPTALAVVSVYCGAIVNPVLNCPQTKGCAYFDGKCQQFSGCQSFLQTTTAKCQAISIYCVSDGTSCVDPKPCGSYDVQNVCITNTSDTSIQLCVWDTTITPNCREKKCSEAATTLITDTDCNKFKMGCVTTGQGCIDIRPLCNTYNMNCDSMIGSDGLCTSSSGANCTTKACDTAPITYKTNDECNAYVMGCLTNGAGCYAVPQPLCSQYQAEPPICLLRMGSDGPCVGTTTGVCQVRTCENAPSEFYSIDLCNTYLPGCKYDGLTCVTALKSCASYTGTQAACGKVIGSDGICWGDSTNSSTSLCRVRICADGETSYNTDTLCSGFLTGCVTNGQGCTLTRGACSSYTGNATTCKVFVGSDGKCEGTNATTDGPCQARACTTATGASYATNDSCIAYQFGCLSTGSGCVKSTTCLATQMQLTCQGTSTCSWKSACVTNTCSGFTSIAMCTNNQVNGRPCVWTGAICKDKLCTDAPNTVTQDSDCNTFLSRCVFSGKGCVDTTASCTAYFGDSTSCPKFVANGKKCWSTSASAGACSIRQCQDNTTAGTDAECDTFLTGCLTTFAGCIANTEPCSSYTGTVAQCQQFKGEKGAFNCYRDASGTNCRNLQCLDNTTAQSDADCNTFLTGCLTNGAGCVDKTVPCSQYPGTSTDICQKFTGNGVLCWWTGGSNCVDRACIQKTSASGDNECSQFLSGCVYNGTGCQSSTLDCTNYSGTESVCNQYFGNGQQCTRKNPCLDSTCSELTTANSHADCIKFSPLCRFGGNSTCIDASGSCSSYSVSAEICNTATTTSGSACFFNGACADKVCSLLASAASQTDCDNFMSGCIWTGTSCTNKIASCTSYTNFTQTACKVAKDTAGNLCWKSTATTGTCEARSCAQMVGTTHATCQQFLNTCTSNGTTCVNMVATCGGYTSFTQAACKAAATTANKYCWLDVAGPGTCTDRACGQITTNLSASACSTHISTCTYNGSQCVAQAACTSYSVLTIPQCNAITDTNGHLCTKVSTTLTDSCIARACSDTLTTYSLTACQGYLSTCTYSGAICFALQSSCTSYTDFTQAACMAAVTTSGDKCYKTYNEIGACEARQCINIPGGSETACRTHLSTCTFNGSACVAAQTTCAGYTNTNYLNCQNLSAYNGNVVTPCWLETGTGTCIDKQCTHNTTATSDQQCETFLTGCITTGMGCTSSATSCSSQNGSSSGCSALLGNGRRCKGSTSGSGLCSTQYCQDNSTATTDSACDSFMKGCLTKGVGCISSSQPCSAYQGTQSTCEQFKGAGRKCTNLSNATSTTSCIERKCADNTSATSDSECANFQTGCITSGQGCTSQTSQCTSFIGTQTTCASFLGNSGKQKCAGNSPTASAACAVRACTHNTTSTTDTECENFLTGCVTNGKGCVSPQACTSFTGTRTTCPTFTATDGPCRGTSYTTATCKAALCTDAPNIYDTDDQCNKFKPGCVTNGFGCVASITCPNYQSEKSCKANTNCAYLGTCTTTATTSCASMTNASTCVQAVVPTTMKMCSWDNVNSVCKDWTCGAASYTLTTHAACQALSTTCTTRGAGCITMTICSGYTDPTVCISAKSTANDTCVWENSACRARACKDAPKALKTDEGCQGYLAGCRTTGYGCVTPPYDCTANITQTRCLTDSAGYPCIWVNASSTCVNYAKCSDIVKTTYSECQAYSLSCTSDGTTCIPFSLCSYYTTATSCLIGTDGTCGWMTESSNCVKQANCEQLTSPNSANCQTFNKNCVSNGTNCISMAACATYITQTACMSTGTDGYCQWDNNACRLRKCSDATTDITLFDSCYKFSAQNQCTTNGTACVDQTKCSTYVQTYCILGTDGYCTYDTTNKLCRPKICTDYKVTTSAACSTTAVGLKCVSNGVNCIDVSKCSSYTDKEACNGGGTDGICVFTASQNNPNVGTCKLMTSCEDAGSDTVACAKAPCIISNKTCQSQTCASQASGGKCNPITTFDKKTITICVPDSTGQCVKGDASALVSSYCFELSGRTYSWNPNKSKCEKCVKSSTPNKTEPVDGGDDVITNGITLSAFLLLMFEFVQ